MEKELIKKASREMKKGLPVEKCPDEVELCRFAEGTSDDKETGKLEAHLVVCAKCCDTVVSLRKVISFSDEEQLPKIPDEQLIKLYNVIKDTPRHHLSKKISQALEYLGQSIKEFLGFDWIFQPIPVAVRSGVVVLFAVLMAISVYLYYRHREVIVKEVGQLPLEVQMELIGKTRMISTRGVPEGEPVETIIKEGDTLYSNDYCRIQFELDRDAYTYVVLQDPEGRLNQLYPDPAAAVPQKLKANTRYIVPAGEDQWFTLDTNVGTEAVFLVASYRPLDNVREMLKTMQGRSKEEVLKTFTNNADVVKVLHFNHQ